jgi:hypothetical protein
VYNWTVPNKVTSINVICTGAGAAGREGTASFIGVGGGGGGTGFNTLSVSPGSSFTVVVGASTSHFVTSGASYFAATSTVCGFGGYQFAGGLFNGSAGGQGGTGGGNNGGFGGGGGGGAGGIGGAGGNGGNGGGGVFAASQGSQGTFGAGAGGVGGYNTVGGAGGGVFSFGIYPLFLYNGSSAPAIAGAGGGAGSTFNVTSEAIRYGLIPQQVIVLERPFLNFTQGDRIETVLLGSGVDQPRGNDLERLTFNITQLKTEIAQAGFGTDAPGIRLHGDDLERAAFNITLVMKQGANNTVSGVTRAASATGETVRIGQQYGLIRFSGDAQERISIDLGKSLPAGSNLTTVAVADVFRRVSSFRPTYEDAVFAQGEKDGNFRYALTQGTRIEDLTATDDVVISNLLFRTLESILQQGDLDHNGNINTMVSNGFLRMTDYVDIEYLENDYVGESRSFS